MSKSNATPDTTNNKNNNNNTTSSKDQPKGDKKKLLKLLGDISANFEEDPDIPDETKTHLQQTSTQKALDQILDNYIQSTNNNNLLEAEEKTQTNITTKADNKTIYLDYDTIELNNQNTDPNIINNELSHNTTVNNNNNDNTGNNTEITGETDTSTDSCCVIL